MIAVLVILAGSVSVYMLERGQNPSITSPGDALWWSIVTTTTVGYGDVSPTTLKGPVIAVVLMLVGIGAIGTFTATLASYITEQTDDASDSLERRLERIERKLDELINNERPPRELVRRG